MPEASAVAVTLDALPALDTDGTTVHMVVEAPRGATVKLKYEPKLRAFTPARALPLGLAYPFDWGFVPGTRAEDGDPVDALALHDAATYPGVVLRCRCLALIELDQRTGQGDARERNDRLLLLPTWEDRLAGITELHALPQRMREEVEQFFLSTTFFTAKEARVLGWRDAHHALAFLRKHRT